MTIKLNGVCASDQVVGAVIQQETITWVECCGIEPKLISELLIVVSKLMHKIYLDASCIERPEQEIAIGALNEVMSIVGIDPRHISTIGPLSLKSQSRTTLGELFRPLEDRLQVLEAFLCL